MLERPAQQGQTENGADGFSGLPSTSTVEVTLLSAEDSLAPLLAAARQGRSSQPANPASTRGRSSNGPAAPAGGRLQPPNGLRSAQTNGPGAAVSSGLQRAAAGGAAPGTAAAQARSAAAMAKSGSSGDLLGFLSMLTAAQTAGSGAADPRSGNDAVLPLSSSLGRERPHEDGCDGACSDASVSSFTGGGTGSGVPSGRASAEGAYPQPGAENIIPRSTSYDLFDGGGEPASWLSANGGTETAEGGAREDWVAKKGSLRWIRQGGGGIQADGGGPIRRRARRGIRARGDMGYGLLRSPWSWGEAAQEASTAAASPDCGAAHPNGAVSDQDCLGIPRNLSNGAFSQESDWSQRNGRGSRVSLFAEDTADVNPGEGFGEGSERRASTDRGSRGRWFSLSGGQSTEDLLSAFTKNLEAAEEPPAQAKSSDAHGCCRLPSCSRHCAVHTHPALSGLML